MQIQSFYKRFIKTIHGARTSRNVVIGVMVIIGVIAAVLLIRNTPGLMSGGKPGIVRAR